MKKKLAALVAVTLALSFTAVVIAAAAPAKITGEIIDSACYIKMGKSATGQGHKDCAVNCGKAGIPLALLEDKTENVVWLSANKDMNSVNDMLMPYVAQKVTLTGKWFERGGTKLFAIDKVEPAK